MRTLQNLRNRIHLIGRLGQDPQVKQFGSGHRLATFSLATDESYKNSAGKRIDETQWHTVVVRGPQVSVVEKYMHKGKEVAIEGKIQNRSYETKSGEKRFVTEVLAHSILLLGKKDEH